MIAAFDRASADVGPAVIPLRGALPSSMVGVVRLPAVPYLRFAEILGRMMPDPDASRLARSSGGEVAALQRLLGHLELPDWLDEFDRGALAVLLLAGSFEPGNSEDLDALKLLGGEPVSIVQMCETLRLRADSPVELAQERFRSAWTWRAPEERVEAAG